MSALSLDSYFFFLSIFDITKDHCGSGEGERGGLINDIANKTNSKLRSGGTGGCGQGEGRG